MEHLTAAGTQAGAATILLVDDQPSNLLALEAILEPLGHRLVRATSGEEALRHVLHNDVALILLDVQMPGMDGFETAAILKSRPRSRHIPIIFITALSRDAANIFKGYEAGAVDYMLKPLNPDILRSKVAVFVELYLRGEEIKRQATLLRQREQEALQRRSEERFRALTDAIPSCVWALRKDGTLYYANQIWRRYVGSEPSPELDLWANVHPEDQEQVRDAWATSMLSQLPFEMQYRWRSAQDGEFHWMLGRAVPELDEQGRLSGWIASAADITDQKQAEEMLARVSQQEQAARQTAETANRMKDEFLATVSHELRTPLTSILGWASILKTGQSQLDKIQHAAEIIERNAAAQRRLIDDLLDMSRVMSGKLKLNISPVDPRQVVSAAIDSVRTAAQQKQIEIHVEADNILPIIEADPDRLLQVIWNLVANAVKFSPTGSRVDVTLHREEHCIALCVSDNGPGISAEAINHVFDRFWQADATSTRTAGGLGLGLAIVRQLVELHGGRVSATSAGAGHGATFRVELPCSALASAHEPRPEHHRAPPAARPSLHDLSVLLVEDDPDGREAISMMLEEFGARVLAVGSAAEAYSVLQRERPDVLVSDIGLPQEDGYSFLRRVRQLAPRDGGSVPAAALSAYASTGDTQRAMEAGFQAHIAKPVEPDRLASVIVKLAGAADATA